ncbi:spermidine synthase [Thermogladius sp. 4427co]|uniref:spermine/spermidine synthase domain-containing protein n=1 Tax=Thermogladius sp. 4427co TaxID=3450718 RepID=UPI003F7A1092
MTEEGGFFLLEPAGRFTKHLLRVVKVYAIEKSPYQEIAFVEIDGFGRSLVIDNFIQSTEEDEFIYHELLVQPAMTIHPNPRKVLIIGGGEGATLREVLKHNTVEKAVMVDIDEKVVEFSKKYLDVMHKGSFNDPRAEIIIMDGLKYVEEARDRDFDVVILDLTDPYAGPVAKPLYSVEFYSRLKSIMKSDGVVVTQAGSSYFYTSEYLYVRDNLAKVFKYIGEYWTWIPSFAVNVNFIIASDVYDPRSVKPEEFDKRLKERGVRNLYVNGSRFTGLLMVGVLYPKKFILQQ